MTKKMMMIIMMMLIVNRNLKKVFIAHFCMHPQMMSSLLLYLFIIHEIKKLPDQGEVFEMFGMKITIRKRVSNRIKTVVMELQQDVGVQSNRV